MNDSIYQYAYESKIKYWNTEKKLLVSLLFIFTAIICDSILISLVIIGITGFVTVVLGGLSLYSYLKMLRIPVGFLILGTIAIGVNIGNASDLSQGMPMGDWYLNLYICYLYMTKAGLMQMLHVFLRALAAVSAMYMLSLSTPVHKILVVLKKVHVPKLIIELMYLIYRYIFILWALHKQINVAAETRLGYCDYKTSFRTFGQVNWNLFILSMKKASQYYDAMEARGYDGELRFLDEEAGNEKK